MVTALAQGIMDKAYQISLWVPHPYYCATPCRFGNCASKCFDCSGYCYVCYRDGAGIQIGLDTGGIGQDCATGKAHFVNRSWCQPGDLVMRRDGSVYNGGPDEHVGIFIAYDGAYMWTRESAGSQHGVGLYRRPITFWTDGVHYHALDGGAPVPSPLPPKGWLDMLTDAQQAILFNRIWEIHNVIFGVPMAAPRDHSLINDIHNVASNIDHGVATANPGMQAQVKNAMKP